MRLQILDIRDVAEYQLCCGCGACAYINPDRIEMMDAIEYGRRPQGKGGQTSPRPGNSDEMIAVCPGVELSHVYDRKNPAFIKELEPGWGPVLEVWEGYASDPEIRYAGSSGGAATALALYCMERAGMHGTLHIAARPDVPYLNRTVLSKNRDELLAATGSRYAPASPCDGLQMVEDSPSRCVFIGKPCDVAGAWKAAQLRPALAEKIGLTIGIFCAGTPSTRGTLEMIKAMGINDPSKVTGVRYRGMGWPGKAVVTTRLADGGEQRHELTYQQSWGEILEKHRQWRCYVCADHTGEFADIAVGDPWYREIPPDEPGRSLVLVRTQRGREILAGAIAAGYLALERTSAHTLPASQSNLLKTRGAVWGRLRMLRLTGTPSPRYAGMPMFRYWLSELTGKQKLQSTLGTLRRIFTKRLRKPVHFHYSGSAPDNAANVANSLASD